MKAVLISINPKYCELIASGNKTLEIRKSKPKLKPPFKVYIYQTVDKRLLTCFKKGEGTGWYHDDDPDDEKVFEKFTPVRRVNFNSKKIIGEFICDEIYEFESEFYSTDKVMNAIYRFVEDEEYNKCIATNEESSRNFWICTQSCLTFDEIKNYVGYTRPETTFYGWHISNLKIYAEPKELSEFCYPSGKYCEKGLCGGCPYDQVPNEYNECDYDCEWKRPSKRPPQSWGYVEEIE